MRSIFTCTIAALILTACSQTSITSTPLREFTLITDSTPTPRPTETPTAVPTATEIPDPTMPLGEVGKDAEGTYVKMENGDIARKIDYKNSKGEILYEGWAVEKTQKGGIPLLDIGEHNLIPTKLQVAANVEGGHEIASLTYIDNTEASSRPNSLHGVVSPDLRLRLNIDIYNQSQNNDFWSKLFAGSLSIPYTTSTGKSVEGKLGPDTGFITIVVPYDSLDPATVHGVTEWLDPYHESRSSFRSTVLGVDKDGNIVGLIASKKPFNELPDKLIRALVLFHPENVIREEAQTTQEFTAMTQIYVQSADAMGDEKVPDIIITRNP